MPDVLHALLGAIKELPPKRWRCSVDGVRKGPVLEHKIGLVDGTVAWTRWKFRVDAAEHDLRAERDTSGTTTILLDGEPMPDSHLDIHPTTQGISAQLVVRCQFTLGGTTVEYRFDGRLWP